MENWYRLKKLGVPNKTLVKLMGKFDNIEQVYSQNTAQLKEILNTKDAVLNKIFEARSLNIDEDLYRMDKMRVEVLTLKDKRYPRLLKNISEPPAIIFVKGSLDFPEKSIAVVGTRKMSSYGMSACEKITEGLVKAGVAIVSGLALGVDTVAHKKTLSLGGKTIAVIGSGLDIVFPHENSLEWERIEREGTIISEHLLGTPPNRWNFPQRNRVIMGLSRGVLLVESYAKGGGLITARYALDEGRDVFAVPGFISYPSFEGCNNLIKKSEAKLVGSAEDILEEYGWTDENSYENSFNLSEQENSIYKFLNVEKSLDQLILDTKIGASELLAYLMNLEIKGVIKALPGGKYMRK